MVYTSKLTSIVLGCSIPVPGTYIFLCRETSLLVLVLAYFGLYCRFAFQSICALADKKLGASQLLAGGVLSMLKSLSGVAQPFKSGDCGGGSTGPDDPILGKNALAFDNSNT